MSEMEVIKQMFGYIAEQLGSQDVTTLSSAFKLLLSLLLGSVVGMERKRKGQIAGIRTFALISMGATLAMILSIYIPQEYLGLKNGDPGRIAAQVVSGIGFLGAGAIIQMKGSVRGLTTAAGIWMVATIGLAVGAGMYVISVVATALIMFILVQLESIEHRIKVGAESRIVRVKVNGIVTDIELFKEIFRRNQVHVSNVYVEYEYDVEVTRLNFIVLIKEQTDYVGLFDEMKRRVKSIAAISLATQVSI
ncbi:MAG: MgtC/SapB family protein [Muribaculaceae bacterium]|nr:MgtC/SapB family protein [Muribaculaceae bacterium]